MKFDVAALGELLIDWTEAGKSEAGMSLFERNPGGAPVNVLCALSRLGAKTAFLGKVGADAHGDFLRDVLKKNNVDSSGLISDPSVFTTLAFVELSALGERSFSFARKPGADTMLRSDELRRDILENSAVFHVGSLSLTDEPARQATFDAVKIAKSAGAIISYDPNYRAPLWQNEAAAVKGMCSMLPFANLVKISDEELPLITGTKDGKKAAAMLFEQGVYCVVITLGKDGAEAYCRAVTEGVRVPVPNVTVADTTGAGDAFWGGFLFKIVQEGIKPAHLDKAMLESAVRYGNAAASLCVQKRGAIPAMPSRIEVESLLV